MNYYKLFVRPLIGKILRDAMCFSKMVPLKTCCSSANVSFRHPKLLSVHSPRLLGNSFEKSPLFKKFLILKWSGIWMHWVQVDFLCFNCLGFTVLRHAKTKSFKFALGSTLGGAFAEDCELRISACSTFRRATGLETKRILKKPFEVTENWELWP